MKVSILNNIKDWCFTDIPFPKNFNKNKYAIIKTTLNGI